MSKTTMTDFRCSHDVGRQLQVAIVLLVALSWHAYGWAQSLTVPTFQQALHTRDQQRLQQRFQFPADVSQYRAITMKIALTCPALGCDPWDRFAMIQVVTQGGKYEIGRYITPYRKGDCNWVIDVSAYRSLLRGEVMLESFIDTWTKGWELTVDFEFVAGQSEDAPIAVRNLWVDYFLPYGEFRFSPIDLPLQVLRLPAHVTKTVLRVIQTGHGQGNTDNAAEFAPKVHTIWVNGRPAFTHDLWRTDCDRNLCSPQPGNWRAARAGWCPGQTVDPVDYDLTAFAKPGQRLQLDYMLEPYRNHCSPWNLACDFRVCAECDYNNTNHTAPHYKLAVQVLYYSHPPRTREGVRP